MIGCDLGGAVKIARRQHTANCTILSRRTSAQELTTRSQ
jgi:hypothetical protein